MQNIRVQFTIPQVDDVVNLDVHINGFKQKMKFRVETFNWDDTTPSTVDKIDHLRDRIQTYDPKWELYHIGAPSEQKIPVTFRFKG